jgi:competence CoiA-like predicted nuclease
LAKRIGELTPEQAEARRAQRRQLYAQDPERQRRYSRTYRERKYSSVTSVSTPRPVYNVTDYAEEWKFLTDCGMLSSEIIERSAPSKAWFKKHVTPRVTHANCPGCSRRYLVAKSGTLLICGKTCPKYNYTDEYHISRGDRRHLELTLRS